MLDRLKFLFCCSLLAIVGVTWRRARRAPLPPGPRRSFLYGHAGELPWVEPWKVYSKWSKTLGPLIYLYAYGRDIVIVNDAEAATEMLTKRSSLYARRPTWSMVALTGRQDNIAFMDYTERQRNSRAVLQAALNPRAQRQWGPVLEDEALKLMQSLSRSPEHYKQHIKRYLASFITRFTYGIEIEDSHLRLADELSAHTQQALRPGRWLVDKFPILIHFPEWFPGMGFKRFCRDSKTKFQHFTMAPYQNARKSVINGVEVSSMVSDALKNILRGDSKFSEDSLVSAASSIYTAAIDTTTAMLLNFILLITVHQEVQEEVYAEIVSVIGTARLPSLADQPLLPYVNAVMKEIHRFNPVTPVIPRSPMQEDEYNGYRIPKDTWAMFNIWAITHDPKIYDNPEVFSPKRHLGTKTDNGIPKDPRDFTFGFGKRTCPGINLANAQVFLFISQLLAVFHLKPALNASGIEEIPPLHYTSTFVCFPKPFNCRLIPRQNDIAQQFTHGLA